MSLEKFKLTGRRALVTGSSQGIGFAIAQGLAEAGAEVILNGRDKEKLAAAAKTLAALTLKVVEAAFDVTDGKAVAAAVPKIERDHGPIDIVVNNAGMQRRAPLDQFSDEDWSPVLKTNLDSVFYVSKAAASA